MLPRVPRKWCLIVLLLCGGCSLLAPKFERPTISVVGIELVGGNLLRQNFRVKFNVQNPNDRDLPVKGLHATVAVEGDPIAEGQSDRAFVVPAHGNSDFDMQIAVNLALALAKLANRANQQSDSIAYEVNGSASLDLPFMRDLPFRQGGSFSLQGFGNLLK